MKSFLFTIIFSLIVLVSTAQKAPAPEEFSNPTIFVGSVVTDLAKSVD